MKNNVALFIVLSFSLQLAVSQSSSETAKNLVQEAIYLMDNGEIDASLGKLIQARKLDPENLLYVYETALAYVKMEDYPKGIKLLDSIKTHPDVWDQVFQQLGNAYDYYGEREKALAIYRLGIEKFPESGVFHQELGNIEYSEGNYSQAVVFWEDGVKTDPTYPSNYYYLAKLFSFSEEKVWSLIYGELFMLLEPTSSRSKEISKLLFKTYQEVYNKENNFSSIDKLTISGFLSLAEKHNDSIKGNEHPVTFEEAFFSSSLYSAQQVEYQVDILTILKIRISFLDSWFHSEKLNKNFENKLFDYQKLLLDAGLLETYSRWLLAFGNPDEFQVYRNQNKEKVAEFSEWFDKNRIQLSRSDILSRPDYK